MEDFKLKSKGEIIIYKDSSGPGINVRLNQDSVWLSRAEMATLFQKDINTIGEHINNIYREKELSLEETSHKQANTGNSGIGLNKPITYYNLDVIISVGYRVKSKRGTQFRIWATQKLKEYIVNGYVVNQQRLKERQEIKLKELEGTIKVFQNTLETNRIQGYEKDLLKIITDYTDTWILLNKYDRDELTIENVTKKVGHKLEYEKVKKSIEQFKTRLIKNKEASDIFGKEIEFKLKGLLGNVEQTFQTKPLYESLEERAAHLLYFAIKDHPFADGNKRIGSLLFLFYLVENNYLYNKRGERKLNDNALAALALLIAESKPDQKDTMVKLVVNLINKK